MTAQVNKDIFVSLIIPIFNNGSILKGFVARACQTLKSDYLNYEIILVDDGSTDNTSMIIGQLLLEIECVRYIKLSRHFGTEVAISAGFDTAIGDYIVVSLPATDPVESAPKLVDLCQQSGSIILGRITNPGHTPLYSLIYRAYYSACRKFFGINISENTSYFFALSRAMLNSLVQIKDKFRYIKSFAGFVGLKTVYFDYEVSTVTGKSQGRGYYDAFNLAVDLIVSNSTRPLRLISLFALFGSGINFLYFGYIVLVALLKDSVVEGWMSISTQIAFGFFMLSTVLVVLCEYIGRILVESQNRPMYFVADERSSSVTIVNKEKIRNTVNSSF